MLELPPVEVLLHALAQFPADVQAALAQPDVDWRRRPAPQEWSLTEVLCHLRDVEQEVHQVRIRALLTTETPFLPGVTPDEWAEPRAYYQQDGPAALAAFVAARQATVGMMSGLETAVWQRRGQHAFFGPTSLHEILNLIVSHDKAHWRQIQDLCRL
jgi:hypothetical protein